MAKSAEETQALAASLYYWNIAQAVATIAAALATAWAAWAATLAASAASVAAKATAESVTTMRETAERQLRAYLSVEPRGINPTRDGKRFFGHVAIRNTGSLPANNVTWLINLTTANTDALKKKCFACDRTKARGSAVAFPTAEIIRGTQGDMRNIERDEHTYFYIWGAIYYEDGYGKERETMFCHRYIWAARTIARDRKISIPQDTARYHEHGNYAT